MRLNRYIAQATGISRRAADSLITEQRVKVNEELAQLGQIVHVTDQVTIDGKALELEPKTIAIMLNKPVGYVCSRDGQGSSTIYDLLPTELHNLKPVGRLDKDSSGLILLTNDGKLAHELTHPSFEKTKVYQIELDKSLEESMESKIEEGIQLEDGLSSLELSGSGKNWTVTMHEGRNRQIRRTFEAVGHTVTHLHRIKFGPFSLESLAPGKFDQIKI